MGVRLRALRDADRDSRLRYARDVRHDRGRAARRARLDEAERTGAGTDHDAAPPLSGEGPPAGACAISAMRASSSMRVPNQTVSGPIATASRRRERIVWTTAVAVLSLAALGLGAWAIRPPPASAEVRLTIETPGESDPLDLASLAVSPDGLNVAFVAAVEGQPHLWVRPLGALAARPLLGTAGAYCALLVTGQPIGRVLCRRVAQAHRPCRWIGAQPDESCLRLRWRVESRRNDSLRPYSSQSNPSYRPLTGQRRYRSLGAKATSQVTRTHTFSPTAVTSSTSRKALRRHVASMWVTSTGRSPESCSMQTPRPSTPLVIYSSSGRPRCSLRPSMRRGWRRRETR